MEEISQPLGMRNSVFAKESIYRWAQMNVIIPSHIWKQIKEPGISFDRFREILLPFFLEAIKYEAAQFNEHIENDFEYFDEEGEKEERIYVPDFSDECPWARLAVIKS